MEGKVAASGAGSAMSGGAAREAGSGPVLEYQTAATDTPRGAPFLSLMSSLLSAYVILSSWETTRQIINRAIFNGNEMQWLHWLDLPLALVFGGMCGVVLLMQRPLRTGAVWATILVLCVWGFIALICAIDVVVVVASIIYIPEPPPQALVALVVLLGIMGVLGMTAGRAAAVLRDRRTGRTASQGWKDGCQLVEEGFVMAVGMGILGCVLVQFCDHFLPDVRMFRVALPITVWERNYIWQHVWLWILGLSLLFAVGRVRVAVRWGRMTPIPIKSLAFKVGRVVLILAGALFVPHAVELVYNWLG